MILKKHQSTTDDITFYTKKNAIRNIALNTGRDIRKKDYGTISTIGNNAESECYLVKWTSEIYNLQSYLKLGNDVIKANELVCAEKTQIYIILSDDNESLD